MLTIIQPKTFVDMQNAGYDGFLPFVLKSTNIP